MKTKLTVIVALLNEENNLERVRREIFEKAAGLRDADVDLILVDDGSTDTSWQIIQRFSRDDSRIHGIRLSRNFGNHAALLAGMSAAGGDVVMNLAADLQTPPDLMEKFFTEYQKGAEITFGVREQRDDSLSARFFASLFYKAVNVLTDQQMPAGGMDCFMINRTVLQEMEKLRCQNASILGLLLSLGFETHFIQYHRPRRQAGKSKWSLKKKVNLFLDGIFAFSGKPLRLCFPAGGVLFVLGLLLMLCSFVAKGVEVSVPFLLSLGAMLAGVQLAGVALLGEYLYRVFQQTSQKPLFVVRDKTPGI